MTLHFCTHKSGLVKKTTICLRYRYGLDSLGIESLWERDFPHPSRPALGPTQPPYAMGSGSFPGVQRPGRGIKHPPRLAPRLKEE